MAIKFGRILTYINELVPIKSYDTLITWSCEIPFQIKTFISPPTQCLWPPNMVRCWHTFRGLLIINSFNALIMWSCKVTWQKHISATRVSMATKLGRMITYLDRLLPIKGYDPLITWFCDKPKLLYLQYHRIYGHQLGRMMTYLKRLPPIKLLDSWLCGLARSRDKLKPFYLHYYSAHGQQTWQGCDIPWETCIIAVTWPFSLLVLLDHVKN